MCVFQMAHDAGVTRVVALLTLASFWLVVLFTSWCLLPKVKVDEQVLGEMTLCIMHSVAPFLCSHKNKEANNYQEH